MKVKCLKSFSGIKLSMAQGITADIDIDDYTKNDLIQAGYIELIDEKIIKPVKIEKAIINNENIEKRVVNNIKKPDVKKAIKPKK